jgi:hypothetical protein
MLRVHALPASLHDHCIREFGSSHIDRLILHFKALNKDQVHYICTMMCIVLKMELGAHVW